MTIRQLKPLGFNLNDCNRWLCPFKTHWSVYGRIMLEQKIYVKFCKLDKHFLSIPWLSSPGCNMIIIIETIPKGEARKSWLMYGRAFIQGGIFWKIRLPSFTQKLWFLHKASWVWTTKRVAKTYEGVKLALNWGWSMLRTRLNDLAFDNINGLVLFLNFRIKLWFIYSYFKRWQLLISWHCQL